MSPPTSQPAADALELLHQLHAQMDQLRRQNAELRTAGTQLETQVELARVVMTSLLKSVNPLYGWGYLTAESDASLATVSDLMCGVLGVMIGTAMLALFTKSLLRFLGICLMGSINLSWRLVSCVAGLRTRSSFLLGVLWTFLVDTMTGKIREVSLTKPVLSAKTVMIGQETFLRTSTGALVRIPVEWLPQLAAQPPQGTTLESKQPGSTLNPVRQSPKGHFALRSGQELIGLGFRLGEWFYTAQHVWDDLNEVFEIVVVNNAGEAVAFELGKGDVTMSRLSDDRFRFTSTKLVQRSATLGLASLQQSPPHMYKTTIVHTLVGSQWHEAVGRAEKDPSLESESDFPLRFSHTCTTESGTSGAPILQNGRVVGLHLGARKKNVGVALCDLDPQWLASVPDKIVPPQLAEAGTSPIHATPSFVKESRARPPTSDLASASNEPRTEVVDRRRDLSSEKFEAMEAAREARKLLKLERLNEMEMEADLLRKQEREMEAQAESYRLMTERDRDRDQEEEDQKWFARQAQTLDRLREDREILEDTIRGYRRERRSQLPVFPMAREQERKEKKPVEGVIPLHPESASSGSKEVPQKTSVCSSASVTQPGTESLSSETTSSGKSEAAEASPQPSASKKTRAQRRREAKATKSSIVSTGPLLEESRKSEASSSTQPGLTHTTHEWDRAMHGLLVSRIAALEAQLSTLSNR